MTTLNYHLFSVFSKSRETRDETVIFSLIRWRVFRTLGSVGVFFIVFACLLGFWPSLKLKCILWYFYQIRGKGRLWQYDDPRKLIIQFEIWIFSKFSESSACYYLIAMSNNNYYNNATITIIWLNKLLFFDDLSLFYLIVFFLFLTVDC